jgi:hypothetical protein
MAKRFTDTRKWEDPWFQDLSPEMKCVWGFILDHCDNAGVWVVNTKLMAFQIGINVSLEKIKSTFGNRLNEFADGKIWVPKFIEFQYGKLSETCLPHKKVFELLKAHGIFSLYEDFISRVATRVPPRVATRVVTTLQEEEEEKEEEKEEDLNLNLDLKNKIALYENLNPAPEVPKNENVIERQPNKLWDSLCYTFQLRPVTKNEKSRLGRAVKDFVAKGATPEDIAIRSERYRMEWPNAAFTPEALFKHWDYMGQEKSRGINGSNTSKTQLEANMRRAIQEVANESRI